MSDAVRVSVEGKWAYLPIGSQAHSHLVRFTKEGLTESNKMEVRLKSDAGPLFWDLISKEENVSSNFSVLDSITENGICLLPNEEIRFGKEGDSYNGFADISWLNNPSLEHGIPLSGKNITEGDIVNTVWPKSKSILPAIAVKEKRGLSLEVVSAPEKGSRCFVLDERQGGLITISLSSNGTEKIRILPPDALTSWLFSLGTKCIRQKSGRFSINPDGGNFSLQDKKMGRSYGGKFNTKSYDDEKAFMEFLLEDGGIGAILNHYKLTR